MPYLSAIAVEPDRTPLSSMTVSFPHENGPPFKPICQNGSGDAHQPLAESDFPRTMLLILHQSQRVPFRFGS